ncbi:MAG: dTDP-4-dehydrorhamnose 3,5-epimerase family protein [Caldilineaceae bacterium]|nr:dTDP-4-dehydrorhamnose 3,5-epimerase family protein [Caldilineaceae bacterium]
MPVITELARITGVKVVDLKAFGDDRGRFTETFRTEWFPERTWSQIQSNRSDSITGVLRGLHYHFRQVDYWYILQGRVRVGLADLRPSSATYGASAVLDLDGDMPQGVFIPAGVAHGYLSLTDATIVYVVDQFYDGSDEMGVAWNDPDLAVAWAIQTPILSERDRKNPLWRALDPTKIPT